MTKKELQQENKMLKQEIKALLVAQARLETKISDLQKANAHGRRGLPWR